MRSCGLPCGARTPAARGVVEFFSVLVAAAGETQGVRPTGVRIVWTLEQACSPDIAAQLDRLRSWLRAHCDAPHWNGVWLIENFWIEQCHVSLPATRAFRPEHYRDRFATLMAAGYAWVNLHGAGTLHGDLVATVELPPGGPSSCPQTQVILSGPQAFVAERGWSLDGLLSFDAAV